MRSIRPITLPGPALLAIASILGGCGHTTVVGAGRMLRLALTEYRVVPQSARAPSGPLTIIVSNDGRLTHNLAISKNGTVLAQTGPIRSGASAELVVRLAPGSYLMASTMFSDQALGEYGTLTVSGGS